MISCKFSECYEKHAHSLVYRPPHEPIFMETPQGFNHPCIVRVISPKDEPPAGAIVVNTTSRTKEPWSRGLSPFFVGPIPLYGGFEAQNLENAWQYCKVYAEHLTPAGEPSDAYWTWAKEGWSNPKAVRFPMGRGAKPAYSLWDGKKLDYVAARKQIYAPLYAAAVVKTEAFYRLQKLYESKHEIYLWDFDGYDYLKMNRTLDDVLNDPKLKMGHAFVLAALLGRPHSLPWGQPAPPELAQLEQLEQARQVAATATSTKRALEADQKRTTRKAAKAQPQPELALGDFND